MTGQVGLPTLLLVMLALFLAPSIAVAGNAFGEITHAALFAERRSSPAEAASQGYRSVTVDLGSPSLDFEALIPARMEIDVSAKADTLETPGRATLATLEISSIVSSGVSLSVSDAEPRRDDAPCNTFECSTSR